MSGPRITGYGRSVYPPGATYGPRRLNDHILVWSESHIFTASSDGQTHEVIPGTFFFALKDSVDFYRWDPHKRSRHGHIHFQLDELSHCPPLNNWPRLLLGADAQTRQALLELIFSWQDPKDLGGRHLAENALATLLLTLVGQRRKTSPLPTHTGLLRSLEHASRAWSEGRQGDLPVDALAKAAGISRAQYCRLFTKEFGLGPHSLLRALRLERAAELLTSTNFSIQDIAKQTGFSDAPTLAHAFRRHFHSTPSALRRRGLTACTSPLRWRARGILQWLGRDQTETR
jgi:AraC-like DNA-binding protein